MNRPNSPAAEQSADLIRRLADADDQPDFTTVADLRNELETMGSQLREPPPEDEYEDESQCRKALEVIKAIGQELSMDGNSDAAAEGKEHQAADLGTLGQYELLEKIGEGGMGAVYKARHTKLDKIVAIKVLPAEKMKDKQAVGRFEREMRAVGKLEHPNIVRAMDAGEVDGMHFLVMEYVKGRDLSQISKQFGPLPIAEACELIRQAAVGLDEAFDNDMVHRDIKPSNLFLAQRRRKPPVVKILDMGLALLSDAHSADAGLTTTGQMMGTLDYMAPEQGGDSKNVDTRADIYALGASLYRLLTSQVIYHGEQYSTPVQKMMALAVTPAPAIQSRREGIPDELAAIVHRMLEKDPAARYATPQEIVDALEPFCVGADLGRLLTCERSETGVESSQSATELGASSSEVETDLTIDRPSDITQAGERQASSGERGTPAPCTDEPSAATSAVTIAPVIQTEPRANPQAAARRKLPKNLLIAGGAGLLGIFGLLAAVVFFFQSPNGTLRVEINDPDIEVSVKGSDIVLKNADNEPVTLKAGEHTLIVARGDFTFETKQFVLKRGETTTVKVELLPGKVQVVSAGSVIGQRLIEQATSNAPRGNYALTFDGTSDFVEVPSLIYDGRNAMTIECYLVFSGKLQGPKCAIGWYQAHLSADEKSRYHFGWFDGRNRAHILRTESDVVPEMVHLAGVYDGHSFAVFLNGKLEARKPITNQLTEGPKDSSLPFLIGALTTPKNKRFQFFHGVISQIRISNGARYAQDFTPAARFEADKDTLALYHFDEGQGDVLKDSSGNNHHGKIVGAKWVRVDQAAATAPYDTTGNFALEFDGKHDHVKTTLTYDGSHPLTIEAYATPLGIRPSAPCGIVSNSQFTGLGVYLDPRAWRTSAYSDGVRGATRIASQDLPQLDERVHVAATYEGEKLTLFVDGKNQGSVDVKGQHRASSIPFFIGADANFQDGGLYFRGRIDEVRISNVTRYLSDFSPAERFESDEHTMALYHFDAGQGDVLRDSSGNDHHGKIVGAKWVRVDGGLNPDRAAAEYVQSLGGQTRTLEDPFRLTFVDLTFCPGVTDEGLAVFRGRRNIESLNLRWTDATDAALANFKDCRDLTTLALGPTTTDAALVQLPQFEKLAFLNLTARSGQITTDGLKHLRDCKNLTDVTLTWCTLTDDSAGEVKNWPQVINLRLMETKLLTDKGLAELKDCKQLRILRITKTSRLSQRALDKLKAALPDCEFRVDGLSAEPASEPLPE